MRMIDMRAAVMAGMLALTAGCVTDRGGDDISASASPAMLMSDTIRISAGPCFGFCPSYSVSVTPDGSGLLTPQRNTAVPGPTRFTVTPAQYRKLRGSLAPFRPMTGKDKRIAHGENCTLFATDMPEYRIEWTRKGAAATELDFQSGCGDARYAKLKTALRAMPQLLEIEAMLKAPNPVR